MSSILAKGCVLMIVCVLSDLTWLPLLGGGRKSRYISLGNARLTKYHEKIGDGRWGTFLKSDHFTWNDPFIVTQSDHFTWNDPFIVTQSDHFTWNDPFIITQSDHFIWNDPFIITQSDHFTWNDPFIVTQSDHFTWNDPFILLTQPNLRIIVGASYERIYINE